MKKKTFQRVLCFILSVTLLLGAVGLTASAASLKAPQPGEEHPYQPSTLEEMKNLVGTPSYKDYIASYGALGSNPADPIYVDVIGGKIDGNGEQVSLNEKCQISMLENPEAWENFGDNAESSIYLPSTGSTTWQVTVDEGKEGLYNIVIEYYTVKTDESSVSSIERVLKIDGKIPFKEVANVSFEKNWSYDYVSVVTDTENYRNSPNSYKTYYVEDEDDYSRVVEEVKDGVFTKTTYTITQDIVDNSMAPSANAMTTWSTHYLRDTSGYNDGYFKFYMADGTRTITLEAERDPIIIKSIALVPVTEAAELPSYADVLKSYEDNGFTVPNGGSVIEIQAEFPSMISDSSVAPTNDNTSAATYPISATSQLYNVIGENSYGAVGQWAAYNFSVTKSGLYNFGMRYKQSSLEGMFICRSIKLSGGSEKYGYGLADGTPTVPFAEATAAEFGYDKDWQSTFVGGADGNPFMFYFEEGYEYTVYLECSLGSLKHWISKAELSLNNLNAAYLRILQYTGTDPDEYTDYDFLGVMPDVLIALKTEAKNLMDIKDGLETLCGTNGSHIATLETIARLLNTMGTDGGINIASNMSSFKSYLGTLGTWINSSKAGTMMVDSIWIVPTVNEGGNAVADESQLPRAEAGFFQSLWLEIKAFFASFFGSYDKMGLTIEPDEDTPSIDVWVASGRDQSQIWRTMIDARGSFTNSTGTAVALKLVVSGTLLPSILSGKGPDVYLDLGSGDVINYAIRDAILGVSGNDKKNLSAEENAIFKTTYYTYQNDDGSFEVSTVYDSTKKLTYVSNPFNEVIDGNFAPAAMDTLSLLNVSYGVPFTMSFAMMFYRMDVLAELNMEIPETWGELLSILPALQSNNMEIGVAYLSALDFMLYQKGGSMWKYTDTTKYDSEYAGAKIDLDNPIALEAFEFTCRLYSDYSFPVSYDAANRFRTGEMPIVIGDYAGVYNQLIIYATEIGGLWEFCSLPGSERADGSFSYDSLAGVGATVLLHGCDDLLAAWQFVQWQTGAEAQAEYGNRIVALIGPAAKFQTANLNAINNLSWTASEKDAILNQMEHMSSIVNYPGSYIINRYVQFAFLDAVNNGADPVDALTSYIDAINSEISRKREEFGMKILEADEEAPELGASKSVN